MMKSVRNSIGQIQKIYQNTFDLSCTYSTRRNLKNYQKDVNRIMKLILWKKHQRNLMQKPM